jgi:acyl-CoA-binding protein
LIAYFTAYSKIKGYLNPQAKKEFLAFVSKVKSEKQDEDVLFFAAKCEE